MQELSIRVFAEAGPHRTQLEGISKPATTGTGLRQGLEEWRPCRRIFDGPIDWPIRPVGQPTPPLRQ